MFLRAVLGSLVICCGPVSAQFSEFVEPQLTPKENAIEEILSERQSQEALDKAVAGARALGVPEQVILEARFLFHVDRAEDKEIANLLPAFRKQKELFNLTESEVFGSVDDWLAVTEYVEALAALDENDMDRFKHHITEAFWLSPRQGAAFAPHIDRIRLMDAMKSVRVDFDRKYLDVLSDGSVSLGEVLGARRGVLLHFWSPWSRECEATLPDFLTTANHLISKDLAVVSILPETSQKVINDAKAMLKAAGEVIPGAWLVDTKKSPITNKLKVQSVPVVVLLGKEGEVLFNGHPTEEEFWKSLEKLNPEIMRPEARENQ
ncbi:TlpA family protein disulfide reductase [Luteolibacter sp. AS25]|uniref:TlpA family protein disulfide reductase n=1 Tax=Luteolibacter sp. AS25 TaxID=3135776 RepID=UPI00398A5D65